MKSIKLPALPFQPNDELRAMIQAVLKEYLYQPLMNHLLIEEQSVKNSESIILDAISSGRIAFHQGYFRGRFSSSLSRELVRMGARWDRKHGGFAILSSKLPVGVRLAITLSEDRVNRMFDKVNASLSEILPQQIADRLDAESFFDKTLWKTDLTIKRQVRAIKVQPELNSEQRALVSKEYSTNLRRYIKDWTEQEIFKLRKRVQKTAISGERYAKLADTIQRSYEVSKSKAKFLARQETNLMLTKFQESRYRSAGSAGYYWQCVHGTRLHPVRPMHKALDGKYISWDNPPQTNKNGDRNHAGEDYNCRCGRRVVIRF
jgi:SPP1 gp7 family putative phage head morphogenesis protein